MRIRLPFALLSAVVFACSMHAAPAQAQRVFVSATGNDGNPCTFTSPCRTFQHAHDTVAANGEIDVLDPAGYGSLTITKAISIQGHGFGGITQTNSSFGSAAITINAGASDAINLNGLLLDGAGTGFAGITVNTAGSVQILDCVVRHFGFGINLTNTSAADFLISDTVVSDNGELGVEIEPSTGISAMVTLSHLTANHNLVGVWAIDGTVMIANSVMSNNTNYGLLVTGSTVWLGRSVVSGNGVYGINNSATVNSYGDNDINGNKTDINGPLGSATTR
jgi:hypothetical protein